MAARLLEGQESSRTTNIQKLSYFGPEHETGRRTTPSRKTEEAGGFSCEEGGRSKKNRNGPF